MVSHMFSHLTGWLRADGGVGLTAPYTYMSYTYMSKRDHSASLPVGHRCLGTQVTDRGLAEVLTSPNKNKGIPYVG